MAKTALLAQNDNLAIDSIKSKVGRSGFDLSHSLTFPIDVDGAILPICCIETVPGDTFEISCECMLKQLTPMVVPVMTNLRLNTAYYYCDNRLAWKKWERFISGGRSGNETFDVPTMYNAQSSNSGTLKPIVADKTPDTALASSIGTKKLNLRNSLHTYFNISLNHKLTNSWTEDLDDSKDLPLAFPFFDYQMICRDFYTDPDRIPQSYVSDENDYDNPFSDWVYDRIFPVDDDEIRLKDGPQYASGFTSSEDSSANQVHGFVLDKVRYHNVRDDYFTTSKKAPMRGDPPEISIAKSNANINWDKAILPTTESNIQGSFLGIYPPNPLHPEYGSGIFQTQNTKNSSTQNFDTSTAAQNLFQPDLRFGYSETNRNVLKNILSKADVDIGLNAKITAAELRLLSQLTVWQELNMLHKPYYNDFLNAHFDNIKVGDSLVEKPQFIGGTSQIIHINEILQQSASTETSPLGTQGAFAQSLENNYVGKFYSNSFGFIIGVAYIMPEMLYEPAIPRAFSRRAKEDYYFPEFANLSMQATLNKEIFFSNDDEWNNTPWGYTGCFDELRSIPNHVAGMLLDSSMTDLKAWTLTRRFTNDNLPSMSDTWLSLKGNVDKTAWAVPDMPSFILQAGNYIKAIRPMPYVAVPKAL